MGVGGLWASRGETRRGLSGQRSRLGPDRRVQRRLRSVLGVGEREGEYIRGGDVRSNVGVLHMLSRRDGAVIEGFGREEGLGSAATRDFWAE